MVVYTLEQRWEILRHYFEKFWQIFDLGGYINKQIVAFGVQKTRMHTLKRRRTQNESLFGADFGPEA